MTPWEAFDEWMKAEDNNCINQYGIVFNRTPEFVFADSPWPGYATADILSIIILCANGRELFELLRVETLEELIKIEPEIFLNLFYAGNAMVLCTTAGGETLQFQKNDKAMIAVIDGIEMGHEVKEQLVVPGDFIRHTNEFFRFMKAYNKKKPKEK